MATITRTIGAVCGLSLCVYCGGLAAAVDSDRAPEGKEQRRPQDISGQIIRRQDSEEGNGFVDTASRGLLTLMRNGGKSGRVTDQTLDQLSIDTDAGWKSKGTELLRLLEDKHQARPRYTVLGMHVNNYIIDEERQLKEGSWTGLQNVRCSKPLAPKHGEVEGTDFTVGAMVYFTCHKGYTLIGPNRLTCLAVPDPFHGVTIWEPQIIPTCRDAVHLEGLPTVCSLARVVGPCGAVILRYYFDTHIQSCLPFSYGGCLGNQNNFETQQACQKTCH